MAADYPCRSPCTPVPTRPPPRSSFFTKLLESCDLFDLLPFVEWPVLWVGAITASDSTLSNKQKTQPEIQHSTNNGSYCTCLRLRQPVPVPVPVSSRPAILHQIAWRFRLASRRRRPARIMHVHMQPLQPPASHRLRSFTSTAMTRLPSSSRACAVLSTSRRRRRAITMGSRSGIIAKWLGGSRAHDSAYLLRDKQRSVGSDVKCASCRVKSL